jgi:competence protein ComEA
MSIHTRIAGFALSLLCASFAPGFATAGPVNINTADASTLARELKGIGLKRAQAIVDYRSKHGPFRSADELALVKGIGPKAIANNRADIRVDARPAAAATPAKKAPNPSASGDSALKTK